jgi:hypothetical protein
MECSKNVAIDPKITQSIYKTLFHRDFTLLHRFARINVGGWTAAN